MPFAYSGCAYIVGAIDKTFFLHDNNYFIGKKY